jgi:signal transduction histidine kinase
MDQPDIEAVFVDALQNIAEGVTDLVGFEVAAISVARDDDTLEMIAVAGNPDARAQLLGHRTPIAEIEKELLSAEVWGGLRFVPHERMSIEIEDLGWVPDLEPSDDPDAWHPLDLLVAPIHDDRGKLRGLMSVDVPRDGRRPGPAQRAHLQRYVTQTRRGVLTALDRAELAEQVRLAGAARKIVRQVSSELSLDRVIEICQPAVTSGFNAVGMWLQTFDADGTASDAVYGATEGDIVVPEEFRALGREGAGLLWKAQDVAVVTADVMPVIPGLWLDRDQVGRLRDFMATTLEASSMLVVPLGAGQECLGTLALTRRGPSPEWSSVEREAALEIGHDLGRALANARTVDRERALLKELWQLAGYKSRLIAMISHELKNPLAAILGHLEVMESEPETGVSATSSTAAIERAAHRMRGIIDDLLVLAELADPDTLLDPAPVDLAILVGEALDLQRLGRRSRALPRVQQPHQQRRQVHTQWRNDHDLSVPHHPRSRTGGGRHGTGHLRAGPKAPVRGVLPIDEPRRARHARHRTRTQHRAPHRRAAPGSHPGRLPTR